MIIFYDNDTPGLVQAKKYSEQYNLPYIYLPLDGPKDISDYYKAFGKEATIKILKQTKFYYKNNVCLFQCDDC